MRRRGRDCRPLPHGSRCPCELLKLLSELSGVFATYSKNQNLEGCCFPEHGANKGTSQRLSSSVTTQNARPVFLPRAAWCFRSVLRVGKAPARDGTHLKQRLLCKRVTWTLLHPMPRRGACVVAGCSLPPGAAWGRTQWTGHGDRSGTFSFTCKQVLSELSSSE